MNWRKIVLGCFIATSCFIIGMCYTLKNPLGIFMFLFLITIGSIGAFVIPDWIENKLKSCNHR